MNTITNTVFKNCVIAAVFAFAIVAFVPTANAADLTYGGSYADGGYYYEDSGFGGSYADGGYYDSGLGGSYADMGFYETGYSSWSPSSFGGFGGGFSFGGGGFGGGSSVYAPSNAWNNGNTYTYAPSNTNICTGGNVCNDNSIFNAPTTVTVSGGGSSYPVYPPIYTPVYPPVYQQPVYTQPPVYIPTPTYRAPYVSLSAVPYTGLELGPIGTVLYWSFLVLWCLVAAYLIAVKKVQNKIVAALNGYLFPATTTHAKHTARVYNAHKAEAKAAPAESGIDPFIASQINRLR